jgi:beta-glucosidase
MCSYSSLNGVPCCANSYTLTQVLRKEFGFKGFVVSDSQAIEFMMLQHHYFDDPVYMAAASVRAGVNLDVTSMEYFNAFALLGEAVHRGYITEEELRQAAVAPFTTRMRLGLFDSTMNNPYVDYSLDVIQSQEHRDLALRLATRSIVLLSNPNNFLPLQQSMYDHVAIVGPFMDNGTQQYGTTVPIITQNSQVRHCPAYRCLVGMSPVETAAITTITARYTTAPSPQRQ